MYIKQLTIPLVVDKAMQIPPDMTTSLIHNIIQNTA